MATLFSLDPVLIEQANVLAEISSTDHSKVLDCAVDILEGNDVSEKLRQFAEELGIGSSSKLSRVCTALGTLLWEVSKVVKKNSAGLPGFLGQAGLHESIIPAFCQVFSQSKARIAALKAPLCLDAPSYGDLSWRLDVELAKRSLLSTSEPTFQLRLNLVNNSSAVADGESATQTFHIQSDYANLKLLQQELQRAVDEYTGVHNQRVMRYIS